MLFPFAFNQFPSILNDHSNSGPRIFLIPCCYRPSKFLPNILSLSTPNPRRHRGKCAHQPLVVAVQEPNVAPSLRSFLTSKRCHATELAYVFLGKSLRETCLININIVYEGMMVPSTTIKVPCCSSVGQFALGSLWNFRPAATNHGGFFCSGFRQPFVLIGGF